MDVNLWGTLLEMSFLLLMPPPPCVCLSVCLPCLLSADQASSSCPERQGKESCFLFLEAKIFAPPGGAYTHTLVRHPGVLSWGSTECAPRGKARNGGRGERGAAFHVPWGDHARVEDVTPKQNEPHTRRQRRTLGHKDLRILGRMRKQTALVGGEG